MPRTEFRKTVEGAVSNSFMHSLLAKGRLLYTHDQTIADLCDKLHEIGERDVQVELLARRRARSRRFIRLTNGSSRAAIWSTPRCGFFTRLRLWRASK